MDIIVGKLSGFCNGVSNTIKRASSSLDQYKKVYCLGEIVHNERVISDLENKGMITISSIDDAPNNSKVIIRAHGEVKETYDKAKEKNIEIIDLTCGKILIIRNKITKKKEDNFITIIGKKNHPETLGIKSFSNGYSYIVENEEDIEELINEYNNSKLNKMFIVSQTTFNSSKFDKLTNIIKDKIVGDIEIDKTICNATSDRQEETKELSKQVDKMIIVGGKHSSNTKELENISKENCKYVYLVQEAKDLNKEDFSINDKIGIMGGASTPEIAVKEIIEFLEKEVK